MHYQESNCYYFICSVISLTFPNHRNNNYQQELLHSLCNSNTYYADSDSPVVDLNARMRGDPSQSAARSVNGGNNIEFDYRSNDGNLIPYKYVISCTMLRLLGHITTLVNESVASTVVGTDIVNSTEDGLLDGI